MALVAKVYNPDYTALLRTITLAADLGCLPMLNEPGSGGLTLPLTAPAHAATLVLEQGDCDFGNIVRFEDGGTPVHAIVIRSKRVTRVAPGEEVDQDVDIEGPGTLSLWSKAVWYPEIGVGNFAYTDSRTFNFASTYLDDSGAPWGAAVEIEQGTGDPGGPREGYPKNLPSVVEPAWWIWSEANDINGSVPAGDAYFRKTATMAGGLARIFITADNSHELWIDGGLVEVDLVSTAGGVGWAGLKSIDRYFTPGDHLFAIKGTNVAGTDPNPAGPIMGVVELTDTGTELGSLLVQTDSTWRALGYPASPPGFTPGEQVRIFMEEAQARGALDGWTLGFTDTLDSDGNAWTAIESTYPIGLDGLSFLRKLAEKDVDVRARPDALVLDMWVKNTGPASGVTLTPGTNVGRMVNKGQG